MTPAFPGEERERDWVRERLETLSVREGIVLAAALHDPPGDLAEAISCLKGLDNYNVRLDAGNYEALGESYLRWGTKMPENALPFVDLARIGRWYEGYHPGLFMGNCYVEYPKKDPGPAYQRGGPLPEDGGWSVRVKLASPAVPEGVWLRLPGQGPYGDDSSIDEELALRELRVRRWDECHLLDARCVLSQISGLMEQYDSVADLIYDGTNLGYVLDERGQGAPHFMERYAAALELEDCHDLRLALDISQNLNCYDWLPCDGPEGFAAKRLRDAGVSDGLIRSGTIDLNGCGTKLLEDMGYQPAPSGCGYIRRNDRQFDYQYSTPAQAPELSGMTML